MMETRHVLATQDGHEIHLRIWQPDGETVGVIQLLHGLGEHINRYERFAAAAAARDLVVCAHDHRGHGGHGEEAGYFADKNGWHLVVDDAHIAHEHIREQFPGLPIVMLGHSMGSYVAQGFAMHYGAKLSGLLLSGSMWPRRAKVLPAMLIARLESARIGKRGKSNLLNKLGFGDFNRRFEPARTEMDWLSRDEDEVDLYVADPLCGGPYTCGLWIDVLGALYSLGSDHSLNRIPADLPILITGGSDDPVGGEDSMTRLTLHYAQTGHQRVTMKLYRDGRHEMLNETNRDEVTRDWLDWIDARVRVARSAA
jgi:alpha-beta hydrolase superfamily lysophospholipase